MSMLKGTSELNLVLGAQCLSEPMLYTSVKTARFSNRMHLGLDRSCHLVR